MWVGGLLGWWLGVYLGRYICGCVGKWVDG